RTRTKRASSSRSDNSRSVCTAATLRRCCKTPLSGCLAMVGKLIRGDTLSLAVIVAETGFSAVFFGIWQVKRAPGTVLCRLEAVPGSRLLKHPVRRCLWSAVHGGVHGEPEGRRGSGAEQQHHRTGFAYGLDLPPHHQTQQPPEAHGDRHRVREQNLEPLAVGLAGVAVGLVVKRGHPTFLWQSSAPSAPAGIECRGFSLPKRGIHHRAQTTSPGLQSLYRLPADCR